MQNLRKKHHRWWKKKQNSFINSFCGNCCINGDDIKISNCSVMECAAHLCLAVLILTTGFSDALVRIWRTYWRKEATPYLPKQQPCLGSSIFFVFLTDHVDPTCSLPARSTVLCYETENVFLLAFPGGPHLSLNSASSSEVSVWILGAPCVHNLSSRVVFFIYDLRGYGSHFQMVVDSDDHVSSHRLQHRVLLRCKKSTGVCAMER